MRMEAEDLIEKAKDIQMLRVTKDLQQRLMEENVTSKDQNEIDILEKTIELNQKVFIIAVIVRCKEPLYIIINFVCHFSVITMQMYKKSVQDSKRMLTKLQCEVNEKNVCNHQLDQQLIECHVSVAEQQQVDNLAG